MIDATPTLRTARAIAAIRRMNGENVRILKHVVTSPRTGIVDTYYTVEAR